jgi:ferritin-like metal-binding protein YciE
MSLETLQDLYLDQLRDLYSAERQIIEALPKMVDIASHAQLRDGFSRHLEQTRQHAKRLEQIGERMGEKLTGKKCKGMEGLLEEGKEVIQEGGDSAVIDAALISAAQRVEHYEIAGYGCARTYADALGLQDDVSLLQQTLNEEAETDRKLTQVALSVVNPDAQRQIAIEPGADRSSVGRQQPRRPGEPDVRP